MLLMEDSVIRILVVAAYPIARAGLAAILGGFADFVVVGQSAGGDSLVALAESAAPDLILLDHEAGDDEALERLERLLAARAGLSALVLGTERTEDALLEALGSGARGYLPRETGGEELAAAARAVAAGLVGMRPAPGAGVVERVRGRPRVPCRTAAGPR